MRRCFLALYGSETSVLSTGTQISACLACLMHRFYNARTSYRRAAKCKHLLRGKPAQEIYPILGRPQPKSWTMSKQQSKQLLLIRPRRGRSFGNLQKCFWEVILVPGRRLVVDRTKRTKRNKSSSLGRNNLPQCALKQLWGQFYEIIRNPDLPVRVLSNSGRGAAAGLHACRVARCHCDHRDTGGPPSASSGQRQSQGQARCLPQQ